MRRNLRDSSDNAKNQYSHDEKAGEDVARSTEGECSTSAHEKTGTDRSSQGNHLRMARLEATMGGLIELLELAGIEDGIAIHGMTALVDIVDIGFLFLGRRLVGWSFSLEVFESHRDV